MRLSSQLLETVEEFFDLVANESESVELDYAMDHLRRFLEADVDGRTAYPKSAIALSVQNQLEEIWTLISPAEKKANDQLGDYFEVLLEDLEKISGYEGGPGYQNEEYSGEEDEGEGCYAETESDEEEDDEWN